MSAQRPAHGPARDGRLHAWAELLRAPAAFTVPGDVLAGTAAAGTRPTGRTALAAGASLCLYEAGMALNDWADREEDATARPTAPCRPAASGPAPPSPPRACSPPRAWPSPHARDDGPSRSPAPGRHRMGLRPGPETHPGGTRGDGRRPLPGPAAGRGRRPGRRATGDRPGGVPRQPHLAVSLVSRRETEGGSSTAPLTALAAAGALTTVLAGRPTAHPAPDASTGAPTPATPADKAARAVRAALAASYAATFARPLAHAALNPSPELTQRAVGAGVRATIALQSGLMARAGAPGTGVLTAALAPLAAHLARKVSTT